MLPLLKRTLITISAMILVVALSFWALFELAIMYELHSTGITRAELKDDMGIGILVFLTAVPGSLICGLVAGFIAWRKSGVYAANNSLQGRRP